MTEWIQVGVIENRFEGDRIAQVLEERGIPYMITSFLDTAYDGLYLPQKGWGKVMVPEAFRGPAEQMVAEVKKFYQEEAKDETE